MMFDTIDGVAFFGVATEIQFPSDEALQRRVIGRRVSGLLFFIGGVVWTDNGLSSFI